ncbi:MAG: M64 family metallopeptidase, partial [Gammaproteobacteria bacterium]
GVNLGKTNIQEIKSSTSVTVMHELGHAHGEMGDEYRSDDDRDVSSYADLNINTTTQNDVSSLKWNHHIEDQLNVLGKDVKVCYNVGDGRIYDRDSDEYVDGADCNCLANEWGAAEINPDTGEVKYPFIRKNPECGKVGLFEGNYYGEYNNYRPTFCSVMDSCSSGGYGKVNVEGFAIGSILNQGFEDDRASFVSNTGSSTIDGFQISLDVEYDESKITLEWYVDGIKDETKTNQKSVIFSRSADNSVEIYTWRAVDLTGYVTAPDNVNDDSDFYEGLFNSPFIWIDLTNNNQRIYNPADQSLYNYGYMFSPLGGKWGINWAKN